MNRLLNKESEEDNLENETVKKRKITRQPKNTGKRPAKHISEQESNNMDIQEPNDVVQSSSRSECNTLSNFHNDLNASKNEPSSDSTSDTSDEDQNYVPFIKTKSLVQGKTRGRGGMSGLRGSRRTGKTKYTRKKNL